MLIKLLSMMISLLICFLILKNFKKIAYKFKLLDIPNHRSLHQIPKPRAAGIAFASSTYFYALLNHQPIFFLSLPLIIIAFIDDFKSLPSLVRYSFQFITVILYLIYGYFSYTEIIFFQNLIPSSFVVLIIFGFTGIINFINFMDGSDGLVASVMSVIFLSAGFLVSPVYFVLSLSLLVFLRFNFPPAKYFMGDIGSIFIGINYVSALIFAPDVGVFFGLIFINTPLFLDPFLTVLKRLVKGENIFLAHNSHLYQRLYLSGFTKKQIVLIYLIPTVILTFVYFITNINILMLTSLLVILYYYYYENKIQIIN